MGTQTGWIEKWKKGSFAGTLKVNYRVVEPREAKRILSEKQYKDTTLDRIPELAQNSGLYQGVQRDLTRAKLTLVGEIPFATGMVVEVALFLSQHQRELKFTAEIGPTESFAEMNQTMHRAGLRLLAIHRGDATVIEEHHHVQKLKHEIKYHLQQLREKA